MRKPFFNALGVKKHWRKQVYIKNTVWISCITGTQNIFMCNFHAAVVSTTTVEPLIRCMPHYTELEGLHIVGHMSN